MDLELLSNAWSIPAQSVTYLADIASDGTSNGSIMAIVRAVLAALVVVVAAGFGVLVAKGFWGEGKATASAEKTKLLMGEAKNFALAEGLLFAVWAIIELTHGLFGGVLSG